MGILEQSGLSALQQQSQGQAEGDPVRPCSTGSPMVAALLSHHGTQVWVQIRYGYCTCHGPAAGDKTQSHSHILLAPCHVLLPGPTGTPSWLSAALGDRGHAVLELLLLMFTSGSHFIAPEAHNLQEARFNLVHGYGWFSPWRMLLGRCIMAQGSGRGKLLTS